MSAHDPLDDRLRDGLRHLAEGMRPDQVVDPSGLADELLSRSVPAAGRGGPGGFTSRWRSVGAAAVVAALGAGFGSWVGSSDPAPTLNTDGVPVGSTSLWRCPNGGVIGRLSDGDRVVLTGRSADGAWLELRTPTDLSARAWASAAVVDPDAVTDELPVVECAGAPTVALDPSGPSESTTTTPDTTTTSPLTSSTTPGSTSTTVRSNPGPTTPSTGAPSTTTASPPDTTGPSLANVGANPAIVWTLEQPGIACPADKRIWTGTVSAFVSDTGGVASVRLDWSVNGRSGMVTLTPTGSIWRGAVGPFAADTLPNSGPGMNQTVNITVRATDNAANTSTASTSLQLRSSAECFG